MSQSSSSESDSDGVHKLYLPDESLIRNATLVQQGKQYDTANGDTAEVTLADTSVLEADGKTYRAICVVKNGDNVEYHQLKPNQEESVIVSACKENGRVKPSFTRWVNLIRQGKYPQDASEDEQHLFGNCLLSSVLVKAKMDAKRARDAASRRKRQLISTEQSEPKRLATSDAHIEINASGPGPQVIELLKKLVGTNSS